MQKTTVLRWLRRVGLAEGVSFLVLLLVAMPLKYIWRQPAAVTWVGWAHGFLFVTYGLLALQAYNRLQWPFKTLLLAGVAALLPLGTFVFDKRLRQEEQRVKSEG